MMKHVCYCETSFNVVSSICLLRSVGDYSISESDRELEKHVVAENYSGGQRSALMCMAFEQKSAMIVTQGLVFYGSYPKHCPIQSSFMTGREQCFHPARCVCKTYIPVIVSMTPQYNTSRTNHRSYIK